MQKRKPRSPASSSRPRIVMTDEQCDYWNTNMLDWMKQQGYARQRQTELHFRTFIRLMELYCNRFNIDRNYMLSRLMRMNWVEPSAADHYIIRWDLVRR